jgi:hypothetical protein
MVDVANNAIVMNAEAKWCVVFLVKVKLECVTATGEVLETLEHLVETGLAGEADVETLALVEVDEYAGVELIDGPAYDCSAAK